MVELDSEKKEKLRTLRTEAVEDFVKQVYLLQQQVDPVPTTLLAQALNIKAPSVTDMIKRLSEGLDGIPPLLDYTRYKGVRLSVLGEKIALEVIRHHRLLELYLSQELGYTWDQVHDEAEKLEHHISEQLESRIADALGNPELDPHGDPIPALDGTVADLDLTLLSDLPAGEKVTVSRIIDQTPEVLHYFAELGLTPGVTVTVTERAPLGDTVSLCIDPQADAHPRQPAAGKDKTISVQVARKVLVTPE